MRRKQGFAWTDISSERISPFSERSCQTPGFTATPDCTDQMWVSRRTTVQTSWGGRLSAYPHRCLLRILHVSLLVSSSWKRPGMFYWTGSCFSPIIKWHGHMCAFTSFHMAGLSVLTVQVLSDQIGNTVHAVPIIVPTSYRVPCGCRFLQSGAEAVDACTWHQWANRLGF